MFGVPGCAALREGFCYLNRGSRLHPQVERFEQCIPAKGAVLILDGEGYYPKPQEYDLRDVPTRVGGPTHAELAFFELEIRERRLQELEETDRAFFGDALKTLLRPEKPTPGGGWSFD